MKARTEKRRSEEVKMELWNSKDEARKDLRIRLVKATGNGDLENAPRREEARKLTEPFRTLRRDRVGEMRDTRNGNLKEGQKEKRRKFRLAWER